MNMKAKDITTIGLLTAVAVVVSSWLRIPLFANIKLDLSYIVLTVAIIKCGLFGGIFVGAVSAILESMMFAANGLSFSWTVANVVIAIIAYAFYKLSNKNQKKYIFIIGIIIACFVGLVVVKTLVECSLFNIAIITRIPNNSIAFISDCICMLVGLIVSKRIN